MYSENKKWWHRADMQTLGFSVSCSCCYMHYFCLPCVSCSKVQSRDCRIADCVLKCYWHLGSGCTQRMTLHVRWSTAWKMWHMLCVRRNIMIVTNSTTGSFVHLVRFLHQLNNLLLFFFIYRYTSMTVTAHFIGSRHCSVIVADRPCGLRLDAFSLLSLVLFIEW